MRKDLYKLLALFIILSLFITGLNGCGGCRDTSKPIVSIEFPHNNFTVSGIVTITVSATDNVGVVKIELYIDEYPVGEGSSNQLTYDWDTDNLAYNSQHTIEAKAYDRAGNIGESSVITVTIGDILAPTITIKNPISGSTVSGTVTIQADDVIDRTKNQKSPSGIEKVEFYIDSIKIGESTLAPYECEWNTALYPDGYHSVKAVAYDYAGNSSSASVFVYSKNNTLAEWTFMVFMNGDNNLEYSALDDLNEMQSVGSTEKINIVVQLDKYSEDGCWRYKVNQDELLLTETLGEEDFGNPQTLKDFVSWVINNYPSEKYALVIWNHGAGWRKRTETIRGISYDDHGTNMTTIDVANALASIGKKIDILGMDACLMAMIEVAYQIRNVASYFVGSEETEPGDGWPYDMILDELKNNPSMPPSEFATIIVNKYMASYYTGVTQSAFDLAYASSVAISCNTLAQALRSYMASGGTSAKNTIVSVIGNTQCYSYTDYKDLYDFASKIKNSIDDQTVKDSAQGVMDAINSLVIAEGHSGSSVANSHGVSVWLPNDYYQFNSGSSSYQELDFAKDTQWDEFLQDLYGN